MFKDPTCCNLKKVDTSGTGNECGADLALLSGLESVLLLTQQRPPTSALTNAMAEQEGERETKEEEENQ